MVAVLFRENIFLRGKFVFFCPHDILTFCRMSECRNRATCLVLLWRFALTSCSLRIFCTHSWAFSIKIKPALFWSRLMLLAIVPIAAPPCTFLPFGEGYSPAVGMGACSLQVDKLFRKLAQVHLEVFIHFIPGFSRFFDKHPHCLCPLTNREWHFAPSFSIRSATGSISCLDFKSSMSENLPSRKNLLEPTQKNTPPAISAILRGGQEQDRPRAAVASAVAQGVPKGSVEVEATPPFRRMAISHMGSGCLALGRRLGPRAVA